MNRRSFLGASVALGGIALIGGGVRRADPGMRTRPLIGYLGIKAAADPDNVRNLEDFQHGLREYDLVEGQSLSIEQRWAEGRGHTWAREQTAELVALEARVIVANGTLWRAAREVTDTVPIVMTGGNLEHLITQGWAKSAARPGGTVTGLSFVPERAFRKRLEMLMAIAPRVQRLAVMSNLESHPVPESTMRISAEQVGLQALVLDVRTEAQLEVAFDQARQWRAEAIAGEGLTPTKLSAPLAVLALTSGLPTTFHNPLGVDAGLLLYYGAIFADGYQFRRSAWHVARIIAGARPGDLPIEVADQVGFRVNRKTLAALGLTLPPHIAMQVTDWID